MQKFLLILIFILGLLSKSISQTLPGKDKISVSTISVLKKIEYTDNAAIMLKSTKDLLLVWACRDAINIQKAKDTLPYKTIPAKVKCFDLDGNRAILYADSENKIYRIADFNTAKNRGTELKITIPENIIEIRTNTKFYIFISKTNIYVVDKKTLAVKSTIPCLQSVVGFEQNPAKTLTAINEKFIAYISGRYIGLFSLDSLITVQQLVPMYTLEELQYLEKYKIPTQPERIVDGMFFYGDTLIVGTICLSGVCDSKIFRIDTKNYKFLNISHLSNCWFVDGMNYLLLDRFLVQTRATAAMFPMKRSLFIYSIDDLRREEANPVYSYVNYIFFPPEVKQIETNITDPNLMPEITEIIRVNGNSFIIDGESARERMMKNEYSDFLLIRLNK